MASARWISSVCTLLPACLLAQQPGGEVKRMASVRTVNPPVIDGRLDDAVWSTAAVVEDLHQLCNGGRRGSHELSWKPRLDGTI